MNIVLLAGSPGSPSRVAAVVDYVAHRLHERGAKTSSFDVNAFDSAALLYADTQSQAIRRYLRAVDEADAIVIATPVYQSSFSGVIKLLLDLIPQNGLKHKIALPIASGGSPNHLLILDYALKPVLSALGADSVLNGVYVTSAELSRHEGDYRIGAGIRQRLNDSADELVARIAPYSATAPRAEAAVRQVPYDVAKLIRSATG